MSDAFLIYQFSLDGLLTISAAWLAQRALNSSSGVLGQLIGWGLALLLLVTASGEILSGLGALGSKGFLLAHAGAFFGLASWRRNNLADDAAALGDLGRKCIEILWSSRLVAGLSAVLAIIYIGFILLAVHGEPVVYDALTYRLSRLGLWLQEGRITHFATDDARLNYMPVAPDLVMAWLAGAHRTGFAWVALAQTFGGGLLLVATAGLARCTGLGRAAALGAAGLLLGMANVGPQFTAAYTDLFTAGIFAAAFYLWLIALQRGQGSVLGGAGVALALGSKGTLFYLAPSVLGWVVWCAWRYRLAGRVWLTTFLAGLLAALLLVVPGLMRNLETYGNIMGPAAARQQQHGPELSLADRSKKLRLNLHTSLAQLFEPNAQPLGWGECAQSLAESLAAPLPSADRFSFDELDRRANVQKVLRLTAPDADVASVGVLSLGLALLGFCAALLQRRRQGANLVIGWSVGVGLFVIWLYALLQWHPYSFRFWVLVAPWLAVVAAWGLASLPRYARIAGWALAAVGASLTLWQSTAHAYQAGWPAVRQPERALGYTVYRQVRAWTGALDQIGSPLRVALPVNQPLAAFLRTKENRRIELQTLAELPATAEAAVQHWSGWLVVPARHFAGREGRVEKRTWFFYGDENNFFSLAAYRRVALEP